MTTHEPITSTLQGSDRDTTTAALQATLLDLVDLHLVAKQAHWTVIGQSFRSVHLALDELVADARGFADEVAERSASLGVPPDGRAGTVTEGSGCPAISSGWQGDDAVIEYMVNVLATLVQRMRARVDETDKTDQITQDMLIGITGKLEKAHWMWQAQYARS